MVVLIDNYDSFTYNLVQRMGELDAGLEIRDIGGLTGLAEYRNGGLLLDTEVLKLKQPGADDLSYQPGHELIVEWRALTVALLDELAGLVRAELGLPEQGFPLAKVLEGGTWAAGRRIAAERRAGGGPPLNIESDGSVF